MSHSNVAEVNVSPNGRTFLNFQSLSRVMNATLSCAPGLKGTYQYPLSRSKVLKCLLPARTYKDSSIRGRGVSILDGNTVELLVVYAEPLATILLLDQNDWRAPNTVDRLNQVPDGKIPHQQAHLLLWA